MVRTKTSPAKCTQLECSFGGLWTADCAARSWAA